MFLTVTANAALDRLLFTNRFTPGGKMHLEKVVDAVGGKGYDASVALRCLGQKTIALGFIAGPIGRELDALLEAYQIERDLVWVEGETRVAYVLVEMDEQRHSHVISGGYSIPDQATGFFIEKYVQHLRETRWVIAAGSLPVGIPRDFYQIITELSHREDVPVLIDTQGEPLLKALAAGPEVVKMNEGEFIATFYAGSASAGSLLEKARKVYQANQMKSLVVTCGKDGILALTPDGAFQARAPLVRVINAAGAGDVTSACLVWRLSCGDGWVEALRWAAAAGAASVQTEATAECDWVIIQRLYPQTSLIRLK